MVDDAGIEACHAGLHILPGVRHNVAFEVALHIVIVTAASVDNLHRGLINHSASGMGIFANNLPCHAVVPSVAVHEHIFALAVLGIVEKRCLLDFAGSHVAIRDIGIDR